MKILFQALTAAAQLAAIAVAAAGTFVLAPLSLPGDISHTYSELQNVGANSAAVAITTVAWLGIAVLSFYLLRRFLKAPRTSYEIAFNIGLSLVAIGLTGFAALGPEATMSAALNRIVPLEDVVWRDAVTSVVRNCGLVLLCTGALLTALAGRSVRTRTRFTDA